LWCAKDRFVRRRTNSNRLATHLSRRRDNLPSQLPGGSGPCPLRVHPDGQPLANVLQAVRPRRGARPAGPGEPRAARRPGAVAHAQLLELDPLQPCRQLRDPGPPQGALTGPALAALRDPDLDVLIPDSAAVRVSPPAAPS
jgi:hypothetical protein